MICQSPGLFLELSGKSRCYSCLMRDLRFKETESCVNCQKTGLLESLVANGFDRAFFDGRQTGRFIGWIVRLSKNEAFS